MRSLLLLFCVFLLPGMQSKAQYKNDNVLYKTVYPQYLCEALAAQSGYLLLDVRSPGEFSDTSASTGLNIGHLENAVNIDIRQLGSRIREIEAYKNKPVFVYCSHSQRSRRVSKMLADSGFTNINNINGGMTALHVLGSRQLHCLDKLLVTQNTYRLIGPDQLCQKLASGKDVFLLDVRADSSWNHKTSSPKLNAYGFFRGSNHISLQDLDSKISSLPRHKEILVVDLFGSDAALAAKKLKDKGFDQVSVLVEGIDRWVYSDNGATACSKNLYQRAVEYNIINVPQLASLISAEKDLVILDVRTAEEYGNRHGDGYRNIGRLKNAVHIPAAQLADRIAEIQKFQSSPVVVYTFSTGPEAYAAAVALAQHGFKNVSVLAGGLFTIRWMASNVEGLKHLHNLVTDVPVENQ